jgi:Tol biopolymer transport system component
MNRRPKLYLVVIAVLSAAALLPTQSQATAPGKDGAITYMRKDRAGQWQVWVASDRLTGAKQLTRGNYDSGWPVWSPSGKKIAFDSNRTGHRKDSKRINDVFVMNADGSHLKKLTNSNGASGDAAWSPNRAVIAFDSDLGNRKGFRAIYLMNPNGGELRKITNPHPPLSDYSPSFSPDGTHLVFIRARGTAQTAPAALYTVALNGNHLHRRPHSRCMSINRTGPQMAPASPSTRTPNPTRTPTFTSSGRPAAPQSTSRTTRPDKLAQSIRSGHPTAARSSSAITAT